MIKAGIKSLSPLFIEDGAGNFLIDEESGMAYLPATSIVGSFRAYLKSIGEDYTTLFGEQNENKSVMSSVYVSDSFSRVRATERRIGVKINAISGSNDHGAKIERFYLSPGLTFDLEFEIHSDDVKIGTEHKKMIYKCFKALNESYIRFGGNKSSGLGNFELENIKEIEFDLSKKEEWLRYLMKEYSSIYNKNNEIMDRIEQIKLEESFVKFTISGRFTSPLLIKEPESFEANGEDYKSIKSGDNYIVPGSSFKGILRSRIEKVANYFGSIDEAKEIFGTIKLEEKDEDAKSKKSKDKKNMLSRVFVKESVIELAPEDNELATTYNRIKIDRFTGGVRKTALMSDTPVKGNSQFEVIYKKQNNKMKDNYAIGIIALALRDLGTENLALGGCSSIGRGRFKASTMCITQGEAIIDISFDNKIVSDYEKLNMYVAAVKDFKIQEVDNG